MASMPGYIGPSRKGAGYESPPAAPQDSRGNVTATGGAGADDHASAVLLGPPERTAGPPRRSNIVVGRYLGTVVVTVHGELDLTRAGHLGTILADLIDGQGNLSIVVDLQDATATDADSLWVFTEAAERARRRGATIRLNEPPTPLYKELELRGLAAFLCTLLDEDGA
jgi:anti-anti-sigma factor